MRSKAKPYRIIGAYDSETTNIKIDGVYKAFPILHQLGLLDNVDIKEIDKDNVEEHLAIELYRHSFELYERLDSIVDNESSFVPVILCHNLSFDMYGLSLWLSRQNVRVLAKSARKPITFTITDDDGKPKLVIWDTLVFAQMSLDRMGKDCGYSKAVGMWDYDLIRAPQTELTANELEYAKKDLYTLVAWIAWWLRQNPEIASEKLGLNIVTKTGVVRERRKVRFSRKRGLGMRRNVEYYWLTRCNLDEPKTNDELFTMLACTRGGFTFVSSKNASKPYDLTGTGKTVAAYDATSQHPAQMASHVYPYRFREMPADVLELAFKLIGTVDIKRILDRWEKPFPVAFNACFEFENLRPKKDSLFERYGIFPLASARYRASDEDNGDRNAYDEARELNSYTDSATGAHCAFGKIISAQKARLYLTELSAWEVWQAYEWDSVKAVHGYETGKFCKPNDIDVISVMQFYKAKNEFKEARKSYYSTGSISNGEKLRKLGISEALVSEMENSTVTDNDIEACYLSLKADLNSIFGINASNSYKRKTELGSCGIEYVGDFGLCNKPKTQRVWYQFGQRIVGWSRIAQICAMHLIDPYADEIITGDTDSVKAVCNIADLDNIEASLEKLGKAIDKGKSRTCSRVKYAYPDLYDPLEEIGYYIREFTTDKFCASWNKAYCLKDSKGFSFTIAGIPTKRRVNDNSCFIGLNGYADRLAGLGMSFSEICNIMLGYNVTYANDVIKVNARTFPEWGEVISETIRDYKGDTYTVNEPCALSLYPMSKTVNDTSNSDNAVNMSYALANNPYVNVNPLLVYSGGILDFEDLEGVFDG